MLNMSNRHFTPTYRAFQDVGCTLLRCKVRRHRQAAVWRVSEAEIGRAVVAMETTKTINSTRRTGYRPNNRSNC